MNWVRMMETLKGLGIDWRDRRMIYQLYMNQNAVVRVVDGESEPGVIGRGVRQGCPLSPLLFSIYAEAMMIETLEENEEGVMVGRELITQMLGFADDQGMISNSGRRVAEIDGQSEWRLQESYKMKINVKKTKTMVVSRTEGKTINILIEGQKVEQVKKFKYLGAVISEDGRCIDDVKQRIAMGKEAFNKRRELMTGGMGREVKEKDW